MNVLPPDQSDDETVSVPDELTAEEDLANMPPPPANVRVVGASARSVDLAWDPPPAVAVPQEYSDDVVAYRIYRRADGEDDFRALAVAAGRTFTDRTVAAGVTYAYVISSIREMHVEGGRSDPPATARVP